MKNKKLNFDLKAFAANITLDVFGYEKIIHQNAGRFLETYSKTLNSSPDKIQLWIKSDQELKCYLVAPDLDKKPVSIEELTSFFTGQQVSKGDRYCQIVENGISRFIREYCQKWQFNVNQVCFRLSFNDNQLSIKCYLKDKNVDQIAVKQIIKFLF